MKAQRDNMPAIVAISVSDLGCKELRRELQAWQLRTLARVATTSSRPRRDFASLCPSSKVDGRSRHTYINW